MTFLISLFIIGIISIILACIRTFYALESWLAIICILAVFLLLVIIPIIIAKYLNDKKNKEISYIESAVGTLFTFSVLCGILSITYLFIQLIKLIGFIAAILSIIILVTCIILVRKYYKKNNIGRKNDYIENNRTLEEPYIKKNNEEFFIPEEEPITKFESKIHTTQSNGGNGFNIIIPIIILVFLYGAYKCQEFIYSSLFSSNENDVISSSISLGVTYIIIIICSIISLAAKPHSFTKTIETFVTGFCALLIIGPITVCILLGAPNIIMIIVGLPFCFAIIGIFPFIFFAIIIGIISKLL